MKRMFAFMMVALIAFSVSTTAADLPVFRLGVSEYPSWSLFLTAHDLGIIDGRAGRVGPIEKKWGVDIELKDTAYDITMSMYGSGEIDAGCLTDMDSLAPCLSRKAVAILPTSTSAGADQLIVANDIKTIKDLKGVKVFGLENSVSQYCFDRNIELQGGNPADYLFSNQDPEAAATALQTGQKSHKAIIVWNPFCMTVRKQNPNVHVLFDSTTIKGEIIDMVTMARSSLEKKGGKEFACAVIDTYYTFNRMLDDPKKTDEMLTALGSRFAKMGLDDMRVIVKETQFYNTPEKGKALFEGDDLKKVMEKVTAFCVRRGIVAKAPIVAYGDDRTADLCFDPQFIKGVAARN